MKKIKYLSIWILIITLISQSSALAFNIQEMKNTAPVANFTVEKSREVKLLVLTDYAGTDNANLKNALTSMKSELANYAKINIEYASPTDTTIGTQQGSYVTNYWGKAGYAKYTKTGYTWSTNPNGQGSFQDFSGTPVTDKFVYSDIIELPEEQRPFKMYAVPVKYTKSSKITSTINPMGPREYYNYTFINNSGICAGSFDITTKYGYYYPNGAAQVMEISYTEPTFTYEDFWSIQYYQDTPVTNTVIGWDLSNLNYDVPGNTDTFVIFALNNDDTNYYTSHLASNYRLGQLRSDSNLGKFVKDSEARVYSICSDTMENVNLSTNPLYPVKFNGAAQNISLRDLIESSFDGRSIGQKNITGLVNKIKENVKRPSDKVDMIVASDKDMSSANSFVNSIKDNISSDVDFKTNVINMDSLEDVDTWQKYVLKGDYKIIKSAFSSDTQFILTGNGELWARGSNSLGFGKLGFFGQSTTIEYYNKFIMIASNVKDAKIYDRSGYAIYIVKNDGTLWVCGVKGEQYNPKKNDYEPVYYVTFTQVKEFSQVRSIALALEGTSTYMYIVTAAGVYRCFMEYGNWTEYPPEKDRYAPVNTQFVYCPEQDSHNLFYISLDGNVDYTYWDRGYQKPGLNHMGKFPAPVKAFSERTGTVFLCTDNKIYDIQGKELAKGKEIKQVVWDIGYGRSYVVTYDGMLNNSYTNIDKILFVEDSGGGEDGIIVRTLDGDIGYFGRVSYSNLLVTDTSLSGWAENSTQTPVIFDASVGGTAADYLQIGTRFCYVSKQGNIYYMDWIYTNNKWAVSTVNYGWVGSAFDITDKPVKAFSRSKIFNTQLREGAERYFIYISDNVKKDTYFHAPSDYLLLDNLDSTILNYLNANRFNIYVVSPAEARDLKLQYPYVPVTRQQYSLRELIYNSVMDSAFCKDETTVKTLIIRKYDTFTKQGSTTLTILVNEESVRYNQIYSDFEYDPKYSDKWQYTHDPTYFDNSNGLDSNSGKWITEPLYSFSKVGKYTVVSQFRDNPKDDNRFDNYRLWSNVSAPATIIVHRRPIALFTVSSRYDEATKLCTLRANNTSYDLDHQFSRSDKGIAQSSFEYKLSTDSTWSSGLPANVPVNKTYNLRLKVRDIEGAWSNYYYQDFTTVPINSNEPPEVTITKSLSYVYEGDNLDIIMKPIDPDNDSLDLALEEKKDTGSWKTVFTKNACISGSTQTYYITKIQAGDYQYRVTVTDPDGESGSASLSFTAYPLGINGVVYHTPIWKMNWINYNKHLQSIGKPIFRDETFFTGEKYILSATTTQISPEGSITASNVSVKIIERTYSPVLLTKQSSNTFTGDIWNEDMRGTRWRGKQATFLFTVTYSNGTVKTDTVVTNIIDDDYFRVKMSF